MDSYIMKIIDRDNNREVTFPITPESIEKSGSAMEKSFDTIVSGDKPRPKGREAYTYPFSGLITEGELANHSDLTPFELEELLDDWQEGRPQYNKRLRLIVSDTTINNAVYLKSFTLDYSRAGRMIYFNLVFVEWREFDIKVYDANKTSTEQKKRPVSPTPKVHVVKKGENLFMITRKHLGSGARWRELYNANKSSMRSNNPDLIYPGEKLTLPSGWLK